MSRKSGNRFSDHDMRINKGALYSGSGGLQTAFFSASGSRTFQHCSAPVLEEHHFRARLSQNLSISSAACSEELQCGEIVSALRLIKERVNYICQYMRRRNGFDYPPKGAWAETPGRSSDRLGSGFVRAGVAASSFKPLRLSYLFLRIPLERCKFDNEGVTLWQRR